MAKAGINVALFGALLVALGMMPSLPAALIRGLQNFRDQFCWPRGQIHNAGSDLRVSGDIWLVVGGGVLIIVGLTSLLWSAAFV
jgi:hypothetical protein